MGDDLLCITYLCVSILINNKIKECNTRTKCPVTDQRGYDHVEVPQVHILCTAKLRCEHGHQHLEVLSPLG